jgi:hypothetical protein
MASQDVIESTADAGVMPKGMILAAFVMPKGRQRIGRA